MKIQIIEVPRNNIDNSWSDVSKCSPNTLPHKGGEQLNISRRLASPAITWNPLQNFRRKSLAIDFRYLLTLRKNFRKLSGLDFLLALNIFCRIIICDRNGQFPFGGLQDEIIAISHEIRSLVFAESRWLLTFAICWHWEKNSGGCQVQIFLLALKIFCAISRNPLQIFRWK